MIRRQLDSQKYISFAEYYSSNKYIEVIHASRNIIPDLRPMLEILHTQVTMIIALFFENINNLVVGILRTFSRRPAERGLPPFHCETRKNQGSDCETVKNL